VQRGFLSLAGAALGGAVSGAILGVLLNLRLCDPRASAALFANHGVEHAVQVLREPFTGAIGQNVGFEQFAGVVEQARGFSIALIKQAGVVEVLVDPSFDVFEFAEIDDEAAGIRFAAGKGQGDRPVVAVDQCAMAVVQVLAVGERNVAVGFFTGEHGLKA
jgi:hypothetical protein